MTPSDDTYIWVNRWDEFQTFHKSKGKKGRPWAPPWIKLYPQILDDPDFTHLTWQTQLVLLKLFAAFAQTRGRLPSDTRQLSRRLGQRVTRAQLESLNHAGWITICSRIVLESFRDTFWNRSETDVDVDVDVDVEQPPLPRPSTYNGRGEEIAAAITIRELHPSETLHLDGCVLPADHEGACRYAHEDELRAKIQAGDLDDVLKDMPL